MPWSSLIKTDYTEILLGHWDALIFLLAVPLIFILGRYTIGWYFRYHDRDFHMKHELVVADNKAVSVALVGLYAGLALTAWGALYDQDIHNYSKNILGGFVWFFIGVVFMGIFFVFTDKFTLRSACITEETRKGNVSAALCVASNFLSSGIVSLYTIGGGVDRWDEAIGGALVFFVLCRLFLSLSHFGIIIVFRRFGALAEEVKSGNVAAGVLLLMMQTGASVFVTNPMRSSEEILAFFVWCVIGSVAILIVDLLMWFVIVTRDGQQEFSERRWGGVFVEGCGVIAASLAVIPFLPNTCDYTAQLKYSFSERLFSTTTTQKLFQWPNLFYFVIIVLYLSGAKILYVVPSLFEVHPRLWRYVLRFFLATPGSLHSLAATNVSAHNTKGGAFFDDDGDEVVRGVEGSGGSSAVFGAQREESSSSAAIFSSGPMKSQPSLNAAGKVRGRKHVSGKAPYGAVGDTINAVSSDRLVPSREGGGDEGSHSDFFRETSSSAYLAPKKHRGPKTRGGVTLVTIEGASSPRTREQQHDNNNKNTSVNQKLKGMRRKCSTDKSAENSTTATELSQPLSVPEASIDFGAFAAKEGLSRSAFEESVRISEARAVTFGGLLLSVGYLLRSSFATTIGSSHLADHETVLYTLFWVATSTVTFIVGIVVQSYFLWRRFSPPSRTNLASGIVQFGLLIAVALQAGSSIMANQEDGLFDLSKDLPEALFIFLIQMVLIGLSGFTFQQFTSYDDKKAVDEGNAAAAVANAGALIASSLLASAPTTKTSELAAFALFFVIGSLLTHFSAYFITRKIIFGGKSTDEEVEKDRNWGAAAVEAMIAIGTAYAYSALLPELCRPSNNGGSSIVPNNETHVNGTWTGGL